MSKWRKTMKTTKEIIGIVVPFAVTCAVMYLLGAFVSASWNPQDWTWMARFVSTIWGVSFGFMLLFRLNRSA